jgi:uncharacterized protein (TIGR03067 family)
MAHRPGADEGIDIPSSDGIARPSLALRITEQTMKTLVATLPILLGGIVYLHAGEKTSDLDKLQGTWTVVSLTELGKGVPASETDTLEYEFKKDVLTVYDKGKIEAQYQFKVDADKAPRAIDFTHQIGDNKGKTELGIYAFDGDKLKMCLDEKRKGRPSVFEGKEIDTYSVIVLKRKTLDAKD